MSGKSDATTRALRQWQAIDRRLRHGEFGSLDAALDAAFAAGLVRRSLGPPGPVAALCVIEPARDENLVPGPLLLIGFEGGSYGGPRFYRPVSDERRWDTGAFG